MPALKNMRREKFSQGVAAGKSLRAAAADAGYSFARAQVSGSELHRNRMVFGRITELRASIEQAMTATTIYTVVEALADATEAFRMAKAKGNASAMVAAVGLKARLAGLLVERRQIDYRNVDELSDAELESLIADADDADALH